MDDFYLNKYGCVMPFHTTKTTEKQCLPNVTMREEYLEFLFNKVFESICHMPCGAMEVTFPSISLDKTGSENETYTKVYFLHAVKIQTILQNYTIITFLAEVGGYMGLLLGMSLLDTHKLFHWFYNVYLQK